MSRKISQKRLEANRRNAQKSTGPRTVEGKAKSAQNATTHGLSRLHTNPLAPGCFLRSENESQFRGLLDEYVATYQPQHRDELDLLTEAVYAKWRQQRLWLAEDAHLEVTIALNERDLRDALPTADSAAHLSNAIAKSESVIKLYLRYQNQLNRHYRNCLKDLQDLQASRARLDDSPNEPNPVTQSDPPPAPTPEKSANPAAPPVPQRSPEGPNPTDAIGTQRLGHLPNGAEPPMPPQH